MIRIRDASLADFATFAAIAVDSEIGRRYGFEAASLETKMVAALASGAIFIVADDATKAMAEPGRENDAPGSDIAGFAWVDPKGAFGSSPYLKLIAVDSSIRSTGVGSALLAEFEKRTSGTGRPWLLLVSDFNTRAIAFYERHGYKEAGRLLDFAVQGVAEIIMIKPRPCSVRP